MLSVYCRNRHAGRELFGPLSLQAKLLHSPEQALAKLWLELPQEPAQSQVGSLGDL